MKERELEDHEEKRGTRRLLQMSKIKRLRGMILRVDECEGR